ncbi:heterokaryon incompatibility protein-domain-containing protein [Cladorrhinum sp. PSN259]|nr:heterokaryon incompatibility protein-domain-containing protein [Cladorrhinum sp. PSN259]
MTTSTAPAATYRYSPLSKPDAFRLLLLDPSPDPTSPLRGTLFNTTLSDCDFDLIEPWTALSYVWGPPSAHNCGIITLDPLYPPVPIGASLDSALRDLRDETRVRRVWADALCIDQQNIPERNKQVTMMGRIYSTANSTVIHLGSLTEEAKRVLSAVPSQYLDFLGVDQQCRDDDRNRIVELAKRDILTRTWFRRVWIYQELILSKDAWVQCGNLRVRWTDLCRFLVGPPTWNSLGRKGGGLDDGLKLLGNMNYARNNGILGSGSGTLLSLLEDRRGLGATDPRDFVYAHLGLARDLDRVAEFIQVDYNKSVAEVYGQVAMYVLSNDATGAALGNLLKAAEDSKRDGELPTWVPDWRYEVSSKQEMWKDKLWSRVVFAQPAHWAIASVESPSQPQRPRQILGILGCHADEIQEVGTILPPCSTVDRELLARCKDAMAAISALYQSKGGIYYSGDSFGQYPHAPLRGKEDEHRALCEALGNKWVELLGALAGSSSESPRHRHFTFSQEFAGWLHVEATKGRIFVGQDSHGLLRVMSDYINGIASSLDERRLARTTSGSYGVVPAVASRGDIVVGLVGCEWPVVLRGIGTTATPAAQGPRDRFDNLVRSALRKKFPAGNSVYRDGPYWSPDDDKTANINHVEVVGACCVDGHVGWRLQELPAKENMEIFGLH